MNFLKPYAGNLMNFLETLFVLTLDESARALGFHCFSVFPLGVEDWKFEFGPNFGFV